MAETQQKCANCGKEIKDPRTTVQRNDQTFCSRDCAEKAAQRR